MKNIIEFVKANKTVSIVIGVAVVVILMTVFGNAELSPFNE